MSTEKQVELKDSLVKRADGMSNHITIGEDGVSLKVAEELYEDSLKQDGLTLEGALKYQKHDVGFVTATGLAGGNRALEIFKQNPEVGEVHLTIKTGLNEVQHLFRREETLNVGKDKTETRYCTMETTVVNAAGADKSDLKKVRQHLRFRGAELLSK